jgi:D-arginine dehydrogenase
MDSCDTVIVGSGIAGASLAWRLSQPGPMQRAVLLLERESQAGAHATGRSAAMFMESYGPPAARALTRASRAFYEHPPAGFSDVPLLSPRGALYVAAPGEAAALAALEAELRATGTAIERLDSAEALQRVPCLRAERVIGALFEPDAMDIDVHALHQGFLRGARRAGAQVWLDAELAAATHDGTRWHVTLAGGRQLRAHRIVDAAGAWAAAVALRCGIAAIGLVPRRRSAFTFDPPAGLAIADWPVVAGLGEIDGWYFKPDAGRLLASPANADATVAHDVRPEELDIAQGIARIEAATTLTIRRPTTTWAGLRTFAPDGELVIGPDAQQPAFFWLAGQGGYGIQTAAGASLLAAALLAGQGLPQALLAQGCHAQPMAPGRLARSVDPHPVAHCATGGTAATDRQPPHRTDASA